MLKGVWNGGQWCVACEGDEGMRERGRGGSSRTLHESFPVP